LPAAVVDPSAGAVGARATGAPGTESDRAAWAAGAPLPRLELEDGGRSGFMSKRLGMDWGRRMLGFAIGALGTSYLGPAVPGEVPGERARENGEAAAGAARNPAHDGNWRRKGRVARERAARARTEAGGAGARTWRQGAREEPREAEVGGKKGSERVEQAVRWRRRSRSAITPRETTRFYPTRNWPRLRASNPGSTLFLDVEIVSFFSPLSLH
jgi:hypothetical protein